MVLSSPQHSLPGFDGAKSAKLLNLFFCVSSSSDGWSIAQTLRLASVSELKPAMSFGLSLGDFVKLCEMATRVYKNCE